MSAIVVVLWHLGIKWAPSGYGVTAFFVLSGLLITHLLIKENENTGRISLGGFYLRRSIRIFPAFYVFAIVYVGGRLLRGMTVEWPQVIASLTYTRDYYTALVHSASNSMGHTWSLSVEEQFYLLWPFVFVHFRTRQRLLMKILVWTILAVWIYRASLSMWGVNPDYIYCAFEVRMDALAVGCLAALAVHNGIDLSWRSWTVGPLLLGGIWILRMLDGSRLGRLDVHAVFVDALLPVGFALLTLHAIQFAAHPIYAVLNNPIANCLGIISYSLYLYHPIVGNIFGYSHSPIRLAAELTVCVAIASLSYLFVEKPFLRLRHRMGARLRPGALRESALISPAVF